MDRQRQAIAVREWGYDASSIRGDSEGHIFLSIAKTRGSGFGHKLRHARLAKRLTLKSLAEEIECSESMLSKIENGKVAPSLAMLHKLTSALGTNISKLFDEAPSEGFITRRGQRPSIPVSDDPKFGVSFELLTPVPGPALYQASIHSIEPGSSSDGEIVHVGEDFGYVLAGTLEISIGRDRHLLGAGDAFAFPSQLPHAYCNPGKEVTKVLWFNTPPTF